MVVTTAYYITGNDEHYTITYVNVQYKQYCESGLSSTREYKSNTDENNSKTARVYKMH